MVYFPCHDSQLVPCLDARAWPCLRLPWLSEFSGVALRRFTLFRSTARLSVMTMTNESGAKDSPIPVSRFGLVARR